MAKLLRGKGKLIRDMAKLVRDKGALLRDTGKLYVSRSQKSVAMRYHDFRPLLCESLSDLLVLKTGS